MRVKWKGVNGELTGKVLEEFTLEVVRGDVTWTYPYYKVELDDGRRMDVFKDGCEEVWPRERKRFDRFGRGNRVVPSIKTIIDNTDKDIMID